MSLPRFDASYLATNVLLYTGRMFLFSRFLPSPASINPLVFPNTSLGMILHFIDKLYRYRRRLHARFGETIHELIAICPELSKFLVFRGDCLL